MNYVDAGFVLALAAAARSFAPDVWFLVRRLLGAGVRLGALALAEQQHVSPTSPMSLMSSTFPASPDTASLDEGGHR